MKLSVGVLILHLHIPASLSLKEKRGRLKPLIIRLQRQFNISVAEVDRLDTWNEAIVACALVSNEAVQTQRALQKIVPWVESNWVDIEVVDDQIELF